MTFATQDKSQNKTTKFSCSTKLSQIFGDFKHDSPTNNKNLNTKHKME
jgi:hypothetical protein